MHGTRTETYSVAIASLKGKRGEILYEIQEAKEKLGRLASDLEAIDRTLETLGCTEQPIERLGVARLLLFYRGELRAFLMAALKEHGPATVRQLTDRLMETEGRQVLDRRMRNDIAKRVAACLRNMQRVELVTSSVKRVRGEFWWSAA